MPSLSGAVPLLLPFSREKGNLRAKNKTVLPKVKPELLDEVGLFPKGKGGERQRPATNCGGDWPKLQVAWGGKSLSWWDNSRTSASQERKRGEAGGLLFSEG